MSKTNQASRRFKRLGGMALVAILVGVLGWFALKQGDSSDGSSLSPTKPPVAGVADSSGNESLSYLAEPKGDGTKTRVVAANAPEASLADLVSIDADPEGEDVLWLDGVVHLAAGTPSDERIEVTAHGRIIKDSEGRREHRVPMSADGSFRVAVSKRSKKVRLSLSGRYSYLREKAVWRPDSGKPIVLRPILGAFVTVKVETYPLGCSWTQGLEAILEGATGGLGGCQPRLGKAGELTLSAAPADVALTLVLQSPGFVNDRQAIGPFEPGTSQEVNARLVRGARVEGRIVDQHGQPMGDGRISAISLKPLPEIPVSGSVSDQGTSERVIIRIPGSSETHKNVTSVIDEGRFEVIGLPDGDTRLQYHTPGSVAPALDLSDLQMGEVRKGLVWTIDTGLTVRGQVLWEDGRPASGAMVEFLGRANSEGGAIRVNGTIRKSPAQIVFADELGRFEFRGFFEPREIELMATGLPVGKGKSKGAPATKSAEFRRVGSVRTRVRGIQVGDQGVVLTLRPGQPFVGKVVDETGQPVPRYMLRLRPLLEGDKGFDLRGGWGTKSVASSISNPAGEFRVPGIADGSWLVRAEAPGYLKMNAVLVQVPGESGLVLNLIRGANIEGQVLSASGKPVKAKVQCIRVNPYGYPKTVTSRARKGYSIKNLKAGTYELYAYLRSAGRTPTQTVALTPGMTAKDVTLRMPLQCRVVGTVHSDWLQPGLQVRLTLVAGEPGASISYAGSVRDDGTFEINSVAPGRYLAKVTFKRKSNGSSYSIASEMEQEFSAEVGQTVVLDFGSALGNRVVLQGRLLGKRGSRTAGRILNFERTDSEGGVARCLTASDGSYRVVLGGAGTYSVQCLQSGRSWPSASWIANVGEAAALNLDFTLPSGVLTVQLRSGEDGIPIPGLTRLYLRLVSVVEGVSSSRIGVDKGQGRLAFEELAPGPYKLVYDTKLMGMVGSVEVGIMQSEPGSWWLEGSGEVRLDFEGQQKDLVATLMLGASITGQVSGVPEGATLLLEMSRSATGESPKRIGIVRDGRFQIHGVAPGRVWIRCLRRAGGTGAAVSVNVEGKGRYSVDLVYIGEE